MVFNSRVVPVFMLWLPIISSSSIVTHIIKKGEIYQKPKNSVVWEGRPNFSFLFKSCEILEVRGDLSINVEDKKSLRVDRQVGRK